MRRAAVVVALLVVAGAVAGLLATRSGGGDEPVRTVAAMTVPTPPEAAALAKAAAQARLLGGRLGELLDEAARSDHLDVRLATLKRGDVTLRDVVVHKDGDAAYAEATVAERELQEYLPSGVALHYDPKASGPGIVFRGKASLLGLGVDVTARALPRDGAVVVEAEGLPVPTTTLFSDPRLRVQRLTARPVPGGLRARVEGVFVSRR